MTQVAAYHYQHAHAARTYAASAHLELELAWVDAGTARYSIGGRELTPTRGSAIVVPPGVAHATTFSTGMRASALKIAGDVAREIAAAIGACLAHGPFVISDAAPVIDLSRALERELGRPGAGQALITDALTEAVVAAALRELPTRTTANANRDPRIMRAVELVNARYSDPLAIADLAREAAMSRYHFSRAFRAQLGVSPYRFIQDVRIARARELLASSRRAVTDVALSVGFGDLGRFAAEFRARTGELPSAVAARSAGRTARIA